jgi:hypothetical protein
MTSTTDLDDLSPLGPLGDEEDEQLLGNPSLLRRFLIEDYLGGGFYGSVSTCAWMNDWLVQLLMFGAVAGRDTVSGRSDLVMKLVRLVWLFRLR